MPEYTSDTGLVVVDVQNDFADPDGGLYVAGGEAVVPACNREIVRSLTAGGFVVYTQDWHPESTPHFARDGGIWPTHCVAGSWGAELHPRLLVAGPTVRKGSNGEDGYSGFTQRDPVSGAEVPTDLADMLSAHGVRAVVVVGLAFDVCVKATALDSIRLGYRTTVVGGATAAVELAPGDTDRSRTELIDAGAVVV